MKQYSHAHWQYVQSGISETLNVQFLEKVKQLIYIKLHFLFKREQFFKGIDPLPVFIALRLFLKIIFDKH